MHGVKTPSIDPCAIEKSKCLGVKHAVNEKSNVFKRFVFFHRYVIGIAFRCLFTKRLCAWSVQCIPSCVYWEKTFFSCSHFKTILRQHFLKIKIFSSVSVSFKVCFRFLKNSSLQTFSIEVCFGICQTSRSPKHFKLLFSCINKYRVLGILKNSNYHSYCKSRLSLLHVQKWKHLIFIIL